MPKDREEEVDQIYRTGSKLLSSMRKDSHVTGSFPELGLCNHCTNLRGAVTEFGSRTASCYCGITRLTGKQRIRECSAFWDKHHKTLADLLEMTPIFIDPKEKIGF